MGLREAESDLQYCVIIPTRNEAANIAACLDGILRQTIPPDEILVIDGMSEDGTANLARAHGGGKTVRVVDNPDRTIPQALNLGVEQTSAPIIVRVDGHTVIADDYVEKLIKHFDDPTVGGVGPAKLAVASSEWGEALAEVVNSPFGGIASYHYSDAVTDVDHIPFGVYRRSVVEELNGWDPRFLVNQDFEFDYRLRKAGWRLILDPSTSVDWRCSASMADTWHQYARYGKGKSLVAKIHPDSVSVKQALGTTLAPGFAALLVPGPLRRLRRVLALGYLLTLVGVADPTRGNWLRRAGALFTIHMAWSSGFWRGMLTSHSSQGDPYRPRKLGDR